MKSVTQDAIVHGHSTPEIAGLFAKKVGAKRLIMNHFSARYRGDASLDSMAVMYRIEEQALKASGFNKENVAAAWDVSLLFDTSVAQVLSRPPSSLILFCDTHCILSLRYRSISF
jgi:hypothetical protein